MIDRSRRLRTTPLLRGMVRETRMSPQSLILPLFLQEGEKICSPIPSLPGHFHYSPDEVSRGIEEALSHGVNKFLLFGLPASKDPEGSGAYAEDGIVQQGLRAIRQKYGKEVYLITDVCMCEYTSHGHCGILCGETVDNDKTLPYLSRTALSHVQAGADMVAPSDMMDGRVAAIRQALDENGFENTPLLSEAVK